MAAKGAAPCSAAFVFHKCPIISVMSWTCVCVCVRETAIVWCTAEKELRARVVFCVNGQMTHAGREDHISDSKGN